MNKSNENAKQSPSSTFEIKPFGRDTEVIGSIVYHYVDAMPTFIQKPLLTALEETGIQRTVEPSWVPMINLLGFYERVQRKFGGHTIFDIGKIGPEVFPLPFENPNIVTIYKDFDLLYQANHRKGYAGFYQVVEHSEETQEMLLRAYTPYPAMLTKGILTGFGRQYGSMVQVNQLLDHPLRLDSENDQWFMITYRE